MSENIFSQIESWIRIVKDANESLATVMRHDQDHDNWHRMHGDAPCTSEADCAAKRAKYAEVKDEQAVTKGDLPGHEFHGNQYEAGEGGGGNLTPSGHRPLNEIARDIEKVWNANSKNGVHYTAKPYLDALKQLHDIKDNYMFDSAKSVVNYLLSNMGTFRGEGAPELKNELKALVKQYTAGSGGGKTAQITSDSKTKPTASGPAANLARTHTSINNALKAAVSANGDLKDLISTSKSSKTRGYYGTVGDDDLMWGTHLDLKDAHEKLAALHTRAATQATKVGDTELANAHIQAANAHRLAAETANDRRNRGGDTTPSQAEVKEAQDTARKSARAISASQKILDGSKTAQITSDSQTRSGTSNVKFGPSETSKMRSEAARLSNQVLHKEDAETDAHVAHIELANSHANAARSAREDGLNKLANAHQNAANAHANAAVATTLGGDNYPKLAQAAGVATAKADNINYERPINDGIAGGIIASDSQTKPSTSGLADRANDLAENAERMEPEEVAQEHDEIAQGHKDAASDAKAALDTFKAENEKNPVVSADKHIADLQNEIDAHKQAAEEHEMAADSQRASAGNNYEYQEAAQGATDSAADASVRATKASDIASGTITKADQMGHEFRGNQYSQGQGGGSAPARRVDEGRWNPGDWNPGDHPVLPLHPDFPEHRVGSPFQTNQWEPPIHRTPDAPYTTRPTISPDGHQEPEAGNPFRSNQWHPDGTRLHGMPEITQPEQGPSTHQEGGVGNRFNPTSPSKVLDYLRSKYRARDNG